MWQEVRKAVDHEFPFASGYSQNSMVGQQRQLAKDVATESTVKPVALFSNKRKSSQEAPADRKIFSTEHQQVLGNNEPLFRFSLTRKIR